MSIKDNFPTISPSLSLNFARSKTLDPRITFSRTSTATRVNETGLIEVMSADEPRFNHKYENGVVKSLGLLVEESRVNQIRNNTMIGASIGTPPTNWIPINRSGLTWSITGTGIDAGVYYVDIRLSGTSNATSSPTFTFESASQISASNGQTWSTSCFIKLVSGTTNGITQIILAHDERSGAYLTGGNSANFLSSINSSTTNIFSSCRYSFTRTNTNASTTFLLPYLLVTPTNGAVIDMTLRIGMPQTELGTFITSVIPTSGSTSTRNPDNVSMTGTNFSDWYNPSEGSIYVKYNINGYYATDGFNRIFEITDGTNSNWYAELLLGTNSSLYDSWIIAGSQNLNYNPSSITFGDFYQIAVGFGTNLTRYTYDASGNLDINTDTSIGISTFSPTKLLIGMEQSANIRQLNGHISHLSYYPTKLSDDQLQNLILQ